MQCLRIGGKGVLLDKQDSPAWANLDACWFSLAQSAFKGKLLFFVKSHGPKRTTRNTITAPYTGITVYDNRAQGILGAVNRTHRAGCQARRIRALFAGQRNMVWKPGGAPVKREQADPAFVGMHLTIVRQRAGKFTASTANTFFRYYFKPERHGKHLLV